MPHIDDILANGVDSDKIQPNYIAPSDSIITWVKVFRINPEFRIFRLTFHRKSALKSCIRDIIIGFPIYLQSAERQLTI